MAHELFPALRAACTPCGTKAKNASHSENETLASRVQAKIEIPKKFKEPGDTD